MRKGLYDFYLASEMYDDKKNGSVTIMYSQERNITNTGHVHWKYAILEYKNMLVIHIPLFCIWDLICRTMEANASILKQQNKVMIVFISICFWLISLINHCTLYHENKFIRLS